MNVAVLVSRDVYHPYRYIAVNDASQIGNIMIIRKLEEEGAEYEVDGRNASSLFFADDSMLFSRMKQDAEKNLEIMVEVGRE